MNIWFIKECCEKPNAVYFSNPECFQTINQAKASKRLIALNFFLTKAIETKAKLIAFSSIRGSCKLDGGE